MFLFMSSVLHFCGKLIKCQSLILEAVLTLIFMYSKVNIFKLFFQHYHTICYKEKILINLRGSIRLKIQKYSIFQVESESYYTFGINISHTVGYYSTKSITFGIIGTKIVYRRFSFFYSC